ncbi:hypothetical protein BJ742DRAFT_803631 [Cladochytrium replicatum]|nr:hypothetical protein BJ742DRAFT_803631 [Cladochytrium replicatum]
MAVTTDDQKLKDEARKFLDSLFDEDSPLAFGETAHVEPEAVSSASLGAGASSTLPLTAKATTNASSSTLPKAASSSSTLPPGSKKSLGLFAKAFSTIERILPKGGASPVLSPTSSSPEPAAKPTNGTEYSTKSSGEAFRITSPSPAPTEGPNVRDGTIRPSAHSTVDHNAAASSSATASTNAAENAEITEAERPASSASVSRSNSVKRTNSVKAQLSRSSSQRGMLQRNVSARSTTPDPGVSPPPYAASEEVTNVIFSGYLYKQNRHGRFQRRLFRFDGIILLCLSPSRERLPEHLKLFQFDPARFRGSPYAPQFVDALTHFYPGDPPTPALTNPLIAAPSERDMEEGSDLGPDWYTKFYYLPKWIIPTQDVESVRAVVKQPAKDPEAAQSRTFVVRTAKRDYVLRAPDAIEFQRWTFLISRMSAAAKLDIAEANAAAESNEGTSPTVPSAEDDDDDGINYPETIRRNTTANGGMTLQRQGPQNTRRMSTWAESVEELMGRDPGARVSMMSLPRNMRTSGVFVADDAPPLPQMPALPKSNPIEEEKEE